MDFVRFPHRLESSFWTAKRRREAPWTAFVVRAFSAGNAKGDHGKGVPGRLFYTSKFPRRNSWNRFDSRQRLSYLCEKVKRNPRYPHA
jgi:hypothetical protein